jgi:hypothetical protein
MTRHVSRVRRARFVVRVVWDRQGKVSGVIERVATGAKEVFQDVDAIGPVIKRMVQREAVGPSAGSGTGRAPGEAPSPRRSRSVRG